MIKDRLVKQFSLAIREGNAAIFAGISLALLGTPENFV